MAEETGGVPADIETLFDQLDAAEREAHAVVAGLDEARGTWRSEAGNWSVAECLDHLATANRVYLVPMEAAAAAGRARGRLRRGPAVPGVVGRWFVRTLEPSAKLRKMRAPRQIQPRASPPLADAFAAFLASQHQVRAFLRTNADLDLARLRFVNPFIPGVRFSLATGLHVIPAHERRHLRQAARVRAAAERATIT